MFLDRPPGVFNPHLEEDSSESLDNVRFLFDSEDLLETAVSIKQNNLSDKYQSVMLGMLKLNLKTPTLSELIER